MSSRSGRTKRGRTEPIESASVASDVTAAEAERGSLSAVTEPQTESKVVTAAKQPKLSHQAETADGMYMYR